MSIAVLNQVYDEARRLAVAGSVVARGDFRLKKLLPPLDQAGAKAPVFARVADAARKVIDGPEDTSADSLLELTSLVSAVLYTQGETGLAGPLEPVETIDLGGQTTQISARLLKPLLEALNSTGSGRLEAIKEAHERGVFRDFRLVDLAVQGLDDPYAEVADFLAEKVVPLYGKAVLPMLRKAFDPKGAKGHGRRLKLMHAADPAGTRELVKQALEGGSKEVKVAAIACLGSDPEDLAFLIEQAGAKAQDVRLAAYTALAGIDDPAAVAVLEKALGGKDLGIAIQAINRSKNARLTTLLITEIQKAVADLPKQKDKKKAGEQARRVAQLIHTLPVEDHREADALTRDLFARRAELARIKGADFSGADIVEAVIDRMAGGPKNLQLALAQAHAELDPEQLAAAFQAGRQSLSPAEVFDTFSPYLTAKVDEKKKKDPAWLKREAILDGLDADYIHWYRYQDKDLPPLDPRWQDVAARMKHLGMVHAVGQPGHKGIEAFLQAEFDSLFAKAKNQDPVREVVIVMVRLQHPKAADALLASFEKTIGKANAYTYWYFHLIPDLPKAVLPRLEALVPRLKGHEADRFVDAIQELRAKN